MGHVRSAGVKQPDWSRFYAEGFFFSELVGCWPLVRFGAARYSADLQAGPVAFWTQQLGQICVFKLKRRAVPEERQGTRGVVRESHFCISPGLNVVQQLIHKHMYVCLY